MCAAHKVCLRQSTTVYWTSCGKFSDLLHSCLKLVVNWAGWLRKTSAGALSYLAPGSRSSGQWNDVWREVEVSQPSVGSVRHTGALMTLHQPFALLFLHPEKQDLFQTWSLRKSGMCTKTLMRQPLLLWVKEDQSIYFTSYINYKFRLKVTKTVVKAYLCIKFHTLHNANKE